MTSMQLFDALPPHIEAALVESIRRFGVLVPVAVDQDGQLLDGHHRRRIADQLGVDCPERVVQVDSFDDRVEIARTLNADRRHLTEEQRRQVVIELRRNGHSLRAIAGALGAGKSTIADDLAEVSGAGHLDDVPDRTTGLDGKNYPARRPQRGDKLSDPDGNTHTVTDVEDTDDGHLIVHDEHGDYLTVPDDFNDDDDDDDPDPESDAPEPRPFSKPDLGNGVSHPARYSNALLPVFAELLPPDRYPTVLDPFAGTGKIHQLPNQTVGVELEHEWANLHPDTIVGDALNLPFPNDSFDAICTSPTYGNRLADSHNASDPERRRSYTHDLGRNLSTNNSGSMHWGVDYQIFHEQAWEEAVRVLRPGGRMVLNIKDHIRSGELQLVSHWHVATLVDLGLTYVSGQAVTARNLAAGSNADLRTSAELVFTFDLTLGGPR